MKKLLLKMLRIGLIGFGGGSALIPVIEQEVTETDAMISKKEYDEAVIIASITPGALPVELAGQIGRKVQGIAGMWSGAAAMAFPGALLTLFMLVFMPSANQTASTQINYIAVGVTAFITCMLTEYLRGTIQHSIEINRFKRTIAIILGVFVLTAGKQIARVLQLDSPPFLVLSTLDVLILAFWGIIYTKCNFNKRNIIISIIVCISYLCCVSETFGSRTATYAVRALIGVMCFDGIQNNIGKRNHARMASLKKELLSGLLLLLVFSLPAVIMNWKNIVFVLEGWISSILSFGGGDAYLIIADGIFVQGDMISEDTFYSTLVPVVNVLPGSILCKVLTSVGYYVGLSHANSMVEAFFTAFSGFVCSVFASCSVVCLVRYLYDCYEKVDVFQMIKRWVRPIIAGLLFSVVLALVYQNMKLGIKVQNTYLYVVYMLILYVLDLILFYKGKLKNIWIILISIGGAVLLCNL